MAAELVGGALLSASLQFLFERLGAPEVLAYLRGKSKRCDFEDLLRKLKSALHVVTAVLDDAEQKQMRNVPGVDKWLDDVEEAIYEADDVVDEIETDALQLKVEAESKASSSKVRRIPKLKLRNLFPKSRHSNDQDMESKIKRILERLEDIKKDKDVLSLKESDVRERLSPRLPSTSLVEESEVYGRDKERDDLINLLLSNGEGGSNKIGVIPIVGMGGLGKTTLAQLVYNDKKVGDSFQLKAWVCVSEEFDVCRITKTLLQSVSSSGYDTNDLNMLQVKLKETLTGKKFLIVLDDIWNEKPDKWDLVNKPFKGGAQGSKIIVTTRIENVASITQAFAAFHLGLLTEEACWQLFVNASGIRDFTAHLELERIGRKIVEKCKRLPLAVQTLGSLLRSNLDIKKWDRILKSDIWELPEDQSEILPALRLSFLHLPSHLKRCFAYCSIFPKDYELEKEELVLLWMAEGLLPNSKGDKKSEEWGEEYFNDLVSRSFIQPSNAHVSDFPLEAEEEKAGKSSFVMHDLMHDLAKFVAKEFCLQLEYGKSSDIVKKSRHLAYIPAENDPYERFNCVVEATHLRTFLPMLQFKFKAPSNNISVKVVDDLLLRLRCLRVFSLSGYENVEQLPDSIGEQRHLRFLDLSFTSIKMLPESVSMLHNLQTLKLKSCPSLQKLPKNMHCLINLRHLDVRLCDNLEEMPTQISKLKSLQTLSKFIVGRDSGTKIGELKELSDLGGELHIRNLENVMDPEDASEQAKLMDKQHLETLKLEWNSDGTNDDSTHARNVLDMLLPNRTLKKLAIHGYPGTRFPSWVGCDSFPNIVFVELSNCGDCSSLPPLGQLPSLKTLYISDFSKVVTVGAEFYGKAGSVVKPFSSLEILKFKNMSSWKKWIPMQVEDGDEDGGGFKKLRELEIENCDKLIGDLPCFLPLLTKLNIKSQGQLAFSLPRMPVVHEIEVGGCKNRAEVESLFVSVNASCPRELTISDISSSVSIGRLPPTLVTLSIDECRELILPLHCHESLEQLDIYGSCHSLRSFPLDSFPNLKRLAIFSSTSLELLSVSGGLRQNLTFLNFLTICGCSSFVSFPEGGLSAPTLTVLGIGSCKNLKSLPEKMHDLLPRLELLRITDCPEIESFPEGGLPFSMSTLVIRNCHNLIASRGNWNLQRLPKLTSFSIGGIEDVESFPEEGLLPATITKLSIWYSSRLKALDKNGIQQLTSLKSLEIFECPGLQTIPEEGFPTSLEYLEISQCPLLEKKCKRDKGKYWNTIDRIFCVIINNEIIS